MLARKTRLKLQFKHRKNAQKTGRMTRRLEIPCGITDSMLHPVLFGLWRTS
jgi:hypothetical protein